MALNENSKLVLDYVLEHDGACIADDIVKATGLGPRQVNGIITSAFQRHTIKVVDEATGETTKVAAPVMERVPAETTLEDGTHKAVKIIRMTEYGKTDYLKEIAE